MRCPLAVSALLFAALGLEGCFAEGSGGGDSGTDGSTSGGPCTPGATQNCVGAGGCAGGQVCLDGGAGWGTCDCGATSAATDSGTSTSSGTTGTSGSSGGGTTTVTATATGSGTGGSACPGTPGEPCWDCIATQCADLLVACQGEAACCECLGGNACAPSAAWEALAPCVAGACGEPCGLPDAPACDASTDLSMVPSLGGCIAIGGTAMCNPVTNEGCDTANGDACDKTADGFQCFGPPNDAALCGACEPGGGPFCAPGLTCHSGTQCYRFCCTDDDCGTGVCATPPSIPLGVGVCVQ